jgi:16S rRNA (adenine1518-N6/adenine1519-N6)-dimethyltransferase
MAGDDSTFGSPKRTLLDRGLRPRKRFGQNFLVDARFATRVASAMPAGAFVIEIGGGTGSLTAALAPRARATVVLEIDRDLAAVLRERFSDASATIEICEADALEYDFGAALRAQAAPRAICGNLPYYITTPLFERIVQTSDAWEVAVLMVQREYAKRLVAMPGTPEYGSLTAFVGYYCVAEKLFDVGAGGFYPPPAVASSVVRLTPRPHRAAGVRDENLLLRVIRAAFAQRRKTLANCVEARASGPGVRAAVVNAIRVAGLDPSVRGERLGLEDFKRLANALSEAEISIT